MRLSEIVSHLGMTIYAEIGLVLFVSIFIAVLVYTFRRRNRPSFDRARHMPLFDGPMSETTISESPACEQVPAASTSSRLSGGTQ